MNDPLRVERISPLKMMLPLLAFLALAAIWTGYWFYAKSQFQQQLAKFETETLSVQCANRSWGGFPFRIHMDCTKPKITPGGVPITADKLRLIIQAWNANHVIGAVFGPANINGFELTGEPVRFSHRISQGKLVLASLLAEDQTIRIRHDFSLKTGKLEAHLRPNGGKSQVFDILVRAEKLNDGTHQLDSFMVEGTPTLAQLRDGTVKLNSEPSNYLDAVWIVKKLAKLNDDEMNAAQAVISPLLKENNNKLVIQRKQDRWYWGPFEIK